MNHIYVTGAVGHTPTKLTYSLSQLPLEGCKNAQGACTGRDSDGLSLDTLLGYIIQGVNPPPIIRSPALLLILSSGI